MILFAFLVFVLTLVLSISALYFFVYVPAAKREVRERLAAMQQVSLQPDGSIEQLVMRAQARERLPAVDRLLLKLHWLSNLQLLMEQAGLKITAGNVALISAGIGLGALLLGLLSPIPAPLALLLAALLACGPFFFVLQKRRRRLARFEEVFPDAIDLLARAVRAGHAFTSGFALIGSEMPEPVAEEFRTTYAQQSLGLSLEDSLKNFALRVPLPDVRIFVSALLIQRESGGNMAEILDNLATVIRERFRILRQVQILSAEGRLSMYVLMALPVGMAIVLFLLNPEYMRELLDDSTGRWALAGAAVSQFIGYLFIRKIVRIEV